MKKKSVAKKTSKKKVITKRRTTPNKHFTKKLDIPELFDVKDGYKSYSSVYQTFNIPQPVSKQRSFWDLFSNVKHHNWNLMMQKGNYLNDFIKIVEEMPEEQFRILFIEPKDDRPVDTMEERDCGCDKPCFCRKTVIARRPGKYTEYLKGIRLERYDVEIQHLRYLINLQNNGKAVQTSYSIDEFLKRSDAPKKVNQSGFLKVVTAPDKAEENSDMSNRLKELFGIQKDKAPENKKLSDNLVNWELKYSDKNSEVKRSEDSVTRPSLTELFDEAKAKKASEDKSKIVEYQCEGRSKAINDALKTIVQYADMIDDVAKVTTTPEKNTSLPLFWQEIQDARKQLDAFDDFYAKKQVEFVLATAAMRKAKKEVLRGDDRSSSPTLYNETKSYLKARREFTVVKKVLKLAYQQFNLTQPSQVSPESLKDEMAKYTLKPDLNDFDKLFDNMSPTPEVYERVVGQRKRDWMGKTESKKIARSKDKVNSEETVSPNVADKIADKIQEEILNRCIDPNKDFPGLIEAGIGSECVDRWKQKYGNIKSDESIDASTDAFGKTDEEYFDSWKPATTNPTKIEEAINKIKQRADDRVKDRLFQSEE